MIRLGPRTTALAHAFLQGSDLVECVKPVVDEAHLRYGVHVDVGLLHGQCIYLIYRRESKETMAFRHFTSARKLHYLATGKAAFAFLPGEKQKELLNEMTLDKKTGRTITDKDELLAELAITRERGYSLNDEEYIPGLIALGAPLKGPHSHQILGGVSFDFATSTISLRQMEKKYAKVVVELAKTVSAVIPRA
jgi:IclR family pca regulon transcriptional regulator